MARVAGASQYLNQAILSAKSGSTFTPPSVLGESGASSLLDIGRRIAPSGIGISSRARALNEAFIKSRSGEINQLFSLTGGGSATIDAAKIQILGLRAGIPSSSTTAAPDLDTGSVSKKHTWLDRG